MGTRETSAGSDEGSVAKPDPIVLDTKRRRAWLELHHARLRLNIASVELLWAQELLVGGGISPEGALQVLDEAMEDIAGVKP